ncbi:MAG: tRNA adenosine(34) deaminase TadA [Gammaproteobacteria bacterium]
MTVPKTGDIFWMQQAILLAKKAARANEVPVGAIVVFENEIIGSGYNQSICLNDPCAHAEIIALRAAAKHLNNYRLLKTSLYVTLEPCAMCAGAMVHARIENLIYATADLKTGAAGSVLDIVQNNALNHRINICNGVLQKEASGLLKQFFQIRRASMHVT